MSALDAPCQCRARGEILLAHRGKAVATNPSRCLIRPRAGGSSVSIRTTSCALRASAALITRGR